MAHNYSKENYKDKIENLPSIFSRNKGYPLDSNSIFDSLDAAKQYAEGKESDGSPVSSNAYVGQYIAVKNGDTYDGYIIIDKSGRLAKLSLLDSGSNDNLDKVSFKYTSNGLEITVT